MIPKVQKPACWFLIRGALRPPPSISKSPKRTKTGEEKRKKEKGPMGALKGALKDFYLSISNAQISNSLGQGRIPTNRWK